MQVTNFLNEIYKNPDDITLRLIFADWIEDSGKPEAQVYGKRLRAATQTPRSSTVFDLLLKFGTRTERRLVSRYIRKTLRPQRNKETWAASVKKKRWVHATIDYVQQLTDVVKK